MHFLLNDYSSSYAYDTCCMIDSQEPNCEAAPSASSLELDASLEDNTLRQWKKYDSYSVRVDPYQDDKSQEIKLCNFSRPHMRAFHCAWSGFFVAFFVWFAISPLLSEIQTSLNLSLQEVWTSSIAGVAGNIVIRCALGPLCDKLASRTLFTIVLCAAAIPTALTGLVNTATGLYILRLFIGVAGGSFVMSQFWTSIMFTKEIVGTANALVAGWGNLGGGVTQLVMGSVLFPLFKVFFAKQPPRRQAELAWRTVCVVPAVIAVATGITIFFISDDAPKGNYRELKKYGVIPNISAGASFRSGAWKLNTWILFVHYASSFGVELTMYNAAALYFKDKFGLSTETAAAAASVFGWMNMFTRGLGGFLSDKAYARFGMRGRIGIHAFMLAGAGVMVLIFSGMESLATSICVMVVFSIFIQGAEGTTFGIVPHVDPPSTGSIAGIVGAGGSTGAVCFGLTFRQLAPAYKPAFEIMGSVILGVSLLSGLIRIKE